MNVANYTATVGAGGYADYVFEKYYDGFSKINDNYTFLTLAEAEAFVKKHKHLPGIKSYQEIKNNNFEFNQTTLTLKTLEKSEELFLYITELHNEQKKQDNEVVHLQHKLALYQQQVEALKAIILQQKQKINQLQTSNK